MNYQDLAVHTFTTKPWSLDECIEGYAKRGIGGISIWRETLEGEDLCSVSKHLDDAGLTGISLVRGGFFTGKTKAERDAALEENRQALREAAMLELPSLVLVCGATVGQTPWGNFLQICDGIAALADEAGYDAQRVREVAVQQMIEGIARLKALRAMRTATRPSAEAGSYTHLTLPTRYSV